jgi:CO dehydrogenase nickel-insertion accessory protein CooC1
MSSSRDGEVITFYSYKGGTGRTMALANVAWIIASSGKHVLVVDWDLESPGLHRFFEPFLEESKVSATPGVIELINDYASEALNRAPRPDDWYRDFARVDKDAHSLDWEFPDGGKLDFLSAGRQNRDYSAAVCSLDWDNFYERLGGGRFFRALREDMKSNYDYILIDSRTGLSDVADICTIELPDVLAVCFTLSNQSIDGAANVARQISGRYRDRNIRVLPVPMRIEAGEKEKLDVGRSTARRSFEGFPQGMTQGDLGTYWSGVEVPYMPFYAFEEVLATFGDEPGSITSMLASFERITAAVTSGRVTAMRPIPEKLRLQYRDRFTRRPPAALTHVHLSYAPEDRMWADWIEAVLTRAGFQVTPCSTLPGQGTDLDAVDTLAGAQRVIAVLSTAYMNSPAARSLWRSLSAGDAAGIRRQVVPVKVTDARIAEPFNELTPVDLVRADAVQATTRLLWAFDRPWQIPGSAQSGTPRFPAATPRIDNAPTRNHDFTGRAATLEQLRDRLAGSGSGTATALALSGLGGVGKTQLAQEYAHRFKADYDIVWWVPAERVEEITGSLADLARQLELRVGDNVAEAAESALAELRKGTSPRWLLIFDNADNPDQVRSWLPRGNGHVLITSRNKEWTNEAEPLGVEVFSRQESIAHLLHHVPLLDPGDAGRVADALGDLPLAIEQASTWLEQTGMPARAYMAELATRATEILALNRPSDYPTPVVAAWNMSFDKLRDRSPAAVRLLQILAFCSPGGISTDLLYSAATIQSLLPYDPALTERLMLGRIIRDISRFALVKVDPGSSLVQTHRLVQAVIQAQMTQDEQLAARHELHRILFGARPERGETDDPTNWVIFESIWPHLGSSQAEECDDPRTRQLLIDWVRYQWKVGEFESCLILARRLDATWSRQFGSDDQQTLLLRFHLANVLRSQGKYQEARELDRAVLARQRQVLGAEHPNTLMTAGSLGADHRALGDYRQALESDEVTYASFREQFGDDHPRTLMAATNLAISRRLNGDYAGARQLDQDTLEWRRVVLPGDHPYTLDTVANLAVEMRAEGEFRDSAELLRTTLDRYRSVLGEDMVESLRTATSLAVSLRKAGDQAEAMKLAQETYGRYERRFGRQSPEARICALNLACDYAADGDFARAVDLATDVRGALAAGLGEDHPNTLVATNNLACYLRAVGRHAEALPLAEEATARMQRTLGDRHPMTLAASVNLANCLADEGNTEAAEPLGRATLEDLRQVLGPGHPDTLVAQADLAVTLRELGRVQEAETLAGSAVAGLERALGKGHPDLAQLESGQRVNRDLEPQGI